MLRNYTTRLAGQLEFPSQKRKFIEDVVRDVAAPQVRSAPIAGKSNDDILSFLDVADPITRTSARNLDTLLDVYVDRTFQRFLDIANPSPDAARAQLSGLVEGLAGATAAVQKLGHTFDWTADRDFARDLLTGAAVRPITEALTRDEADNTGAQTLSESSDPSGMAMRTFLDQASEGGLLSISDASAMRAAKKTWGIWEKIGSLSRANMQISTPDFATNPGRFQTRKLEAQKIDKTLSQQLAGGLQHKGKQMANRARAPQGKMVRKMILLSDALGIFSGNIISNQRVLDRDDNLALAIAGGSGVGVGNLFPRGTVYANPSVVRQVTEMLLREERSGRIVKAKDYRKFKSQTTFQVVLESAPTRPQKWVGPQRVEMKEQEPQMAKTHMNLPQVSRKQRGRSQSYEQGGVDVKRQKIEDKPLPAKGRPLGGITNPNRLLVSSTDSRLPSAGPLLKNVNPSNPASILKANESLTSTAVPTSNIVDSVAANLQSQLVRDQNHEDPDRRTRLRSACIQMANAKSAAALDKKASELKSMTARADELGRTLISERSIASDKVAALQNDMNALQQNNDVLQDKWESVLGKYKGLKDKYDGDTATWQRFQKAHEETVVQLKNAKQAKASTQRRVAEANKVTDSQMTALRRQLARFGAERTTAVNAQSRLEEQIRAQENDAKRELEARDARIRDVQAKLRQEKDDNFRLSEKNEKIIAEQLMMRNELHSVNEQARQMSEQIALIGRDNEDKEHNIRDLTNQLQSMQAEVEGSRSVALQSNMAAMVSGAQSKVLLEQHERQGQMNRNLMWQSMEMQQNLNRAEEEVQFARSQCPIRRPEDVEMTTAGGLGGDEGGGDQGEGGAHLRPLPEWFGEGTAMDRGDSAFGDIPPYTITKESEGTSGTAVASLLLLLLVIVLYMAYR